MDIDIKRLDRDRLFGENLLGMVFEADGRRYNLAGKIGDGAIGVVRKAVDQETNRQIAIKFLAPEPKYIEAASIEDIYRRFKREGQRGAELDHFSLVKIISYQENDKGVNFIEGNQPFPDNPFILMECIQGRTLEAYLKKSKSIATGEFHITKETLHIAHEVTEALVYLHKRALVHRDVKPANIFLSKPALDGSSPTIKLGDFGIVKWGDFKASISTGSLTVMGQSGLGTIKYMAPEQSLQPKEVDVRSDMFSLGVTLFELFTNRIIPDIYHVFQIREARLEKGNLDSRLYKLGIGFLTGELQRYEHLFELILDMYLKPSGRPSSTKVLSMLRFHLNQMRDEGWK